MPADTDCRSCLTARVRARRLDNFAPVTCKRCGAVYTASIRSHEATPEWFRPGGDLLAFIASLGQP